MAASSGKFEIQIQNKSGILQRYMLLSEQPPIEDGKTTWPSPIETLAAPKGANGRITIRRQYTAICGTSSGTKGDGINSETLSSVPIDLNSQADKEPVVYGSLVKLEVEDGTPYFSDEISENKEDRLHSFVISTERFDHRLALAGNWIIGIGTRPSASGKVTILQCFAPEPEKGYVITEPMTYYLVVGSVQDGRLIHNHGGGEILKIDFSAKASVNVVHDEDGKLDVR